MRCGVFVPLTQVLTTTIRLSCLLRSMLSAQDIPFDVFPLIVGHLNDRVDLYNATLVSRLFYRASIPFLYEDLDSRLISSNKVFLETMIQKSRAVLSNF